MPRNLCAETRPPVPLSPRICDDVSADNGVPACASQLGRAPGNASPVNDQQEACAAVILIATVSGVLLVFFLAASVIPWLIRTFRDVDTAPDGPEPFGIETAWLAIRTADIDRIIAVLGLTGIKTSNWQTGLAMTEDAELSAGTVFVTPPVEGWTFVIGLALPHPVGAGYTDRCLPLLIALGKDFSEVQYFYSCPVLDIYAWSRFSNAKLRRSFAWGDEGVIWNKGPLTSEERALGLKVFATGERMSGREPDIDENEQGYPDERHVLKIAEAWSLNPGTFARLPEDPALGYIGCIADTWRVTRENTRSSIVEPMGFSNAALHHV